MKKRMKKILIACGAIMCVLILNVLSVFAVEDGEITPVTDGGISQYFADISSYRDDTFTVEREGENGNPETITYYNNELSAPTGYEDYIFAGWYTEAECTTTLGSDVTSSSAYAKFVPKQILGIKAQIEAGTQGGSDSSSIRFVTTVDSLKYQTVGFDFEINEKKLNAESDSVYKRLEAKGADDRVLNYTPAKLFHTMSKYFMACTVTDVPNADFGHGIFVTPYWITNDGTKVYSDQDMRTINMGYMPYATNVTASLVTSDSGIPGPSGSTSAQGGCTDGKYYYQVTLENSTASGANPDADNVYIQRFELSNGKWVAGSQSNIMPLQHGNDLTYNKNLTYDGQTGRTQGLIVVCQNNPNAKRVSFVDPDTLTIVNPNNIKDATSGVAKAWSSDTITDTYVEISQMIFSIDYNAARDQYVVGISGGKTFCILDSNLKVISDIYQPTDKTNGFENQGVGSDDSYIYFVFYHSPYKVIEGYSTHVIAVYDWDGNAVTVMNISSDSIPVIDSAGVMCEPETISIYDNMIYVPCVRWATTNFDGTFIYKVDNMNIDYSDSVAEIVRNDKTMGYFTLEDAMADAQQGETINLLADVTVDSTMEMLAKNVTLTTDVAEGVTVTRTADITMLDIAEGASLTIDGKVALDGNKEAITGTTHFITNAGTFKLGKEATVQNVKSTLSSAIINRTTGTLNLSGTLSGNTSTSSGAAVKVNGGTLTVDGGTFTDNVGTFGAAIYSNVSTAIIDIENATFENNIAQATTANNGYGGAISLAGISEAEITGSQFTGNQSSYTGTNDLGGGAIYILNSSLTLIDSQFENNTATKDGGAIHSRNSVLTATGCTFTDNSSENGNGAIYNKTNTASLESCTFEDDTVVNNGGKTIVSGNMQMSGEGFILGTKTSASAAREVEIGDEGLTGKIIITPKSYDTNDKYAVGGAIAKYAAMVDVTPNGGYPYEVITDGTLKLKAPYDTAEAAIGEQAYDTLSAAIIAANENTSATLENPVVITVLKQEITVDESMSDVTGSIKLTTIKDNDVMVTRNSAVSTLFKIIGEAVLSVDGVITLDGNKTITDTGNFISNSGTFILGKHAVIQNVKKSAQRAVYNGGTMYLYGTVRNNESGSGKTGGAVYMDKGTLTIEGALFEFNKTGSGGAIYVTGSSSSLTIKDDAEFKDNSATYGGAVFVKGSATVNIHGAEFVDNVANYGGAFLSEGSTTTIQNTKFTSNDSTHASISGGAIYTQSTTLTLKNCDFAENTAKVAGTAICNNGGTVTISDCTFANETYALRGGTSSTTVSTVLSGKITGLTIANLQDWHKQIQIGAGGLKAGSDVTRRLKSSTAGTVVLSKGTNATDSELARAAEIIKIEQTDATVETWKYIAADGKLAQGIEDGAVTVTTADELKTAIETAIENATDAATIYVMNDITISDMIEISTNITLKSISAVTLTRGANTTMFNVTSAGSLTIGGAITVDGNKANIIATTDFITTEGIFTLGANATIKDASETNKRIIYSEAGTVNIYGTLSGNEATGNSGVGGAIRAKGILNVDGALFENNKSSRGGAIYLDSDSTANISNALFAGNGKTGASGGAIYSEGTLNLTNSIFTDNIGSEGGAVHCQNATLTVTNCTFTCNEAASSAGGAIRFIAKSDASKYADITVSGGKFENNTAATYGGAISVNRTNITVNNGCSFVNNTATTNGGAIHMDANVIGTAIVTITFDGLSFENNTATSGSAIYNGSNGTMDTSTCTFGETDTIYDVE